MWKEYVWRLIECTLLHAEAQYIGKSHIGGEHRFESHFGVGVSDNRLEMDVRQRRLLSSQANCAGRSAAPMRVLLRDRDGSIMDTALGWQV